MYYPDSSSYIFPLFSDSHAFQVLRSKNITFHGNGFLLLEVRVPADGLSGSSNWCYDYQYLCEDFHRRPTGCGAPYIQTLGYGDRGRVYNSDMDIENILGCDPSDIIAMLANSTFPDISHESNDVYAFGFGSCMSSECSKTITGSETALYYMAAVRYYNATTFYTVCR